MSDVKEKILEYMLDHAAFDGWNDILLSEAAKQVTGDKKYAHICFPNGIGDVSDYFSDKCEADMLKRLQEKDLQSMRIRDRIYTCILTRLEIYQPHKEAIRSIIAKRMMPDGTFKTVKSLGTTVSNMWYAAGDNATDYNYYTKRTTLAAVYAATLLYWLKDDSDDFNETKSFILRRIDNVMQFEKLKHTVFKKFEDIKPPFTHS